LVEDEEEGIMRGTADGGCLCIAFNLDIAAHKSRITSLSIPVCIVGEEGVLVYLASLTQDSIWYVMHELSVDGIPTRYVCVAMGGGPPKLWENDLYC
jgi:hypothetical protein